MRTYLASTLFLLLPCLPAAAADVTLGGDPSPWRIASDERHGGVRTIELLRPGRSFGSSPELLTIVEGPGDDASVAAEEYLQEKLASCDDRGHHEYLRSGWEDTLYTWDPRGCQSPDAELDEVGRFFVAGARVVQVTLRLRDGGRLAWWTGWLGGREGVYAGWSGGTFSTGGRRAEIPDAPSGEDCAEDDLDCLLAAQRAQLETLDAINRSLGAGGARPRAGGRAADAGTVGSARGCCAVAEVRAMHLQRANPHADRGERTTTFTSTDTYIYAVVDLGSRARAGSEITFRWVRVDADGGEREVVRRDVLLESGMSFVYGSLFFEGLTPTGDYRVYVEYEGNLAGSLDFEVVRGSSFG